jgi:hypothetical protein
VRQHETDYLSLAAGLLFTILGVLFAISAATGWQIDGRWITPTALIALGAGGVAASLAASKRQQRDAETLAPAESTDAWPTDPFA